MHPPLRLRGGQVAAIAGLVVVFAASTFGSCGGDGGAPPASATDGSDEGVADANVDRHDAKADSPGDAGDADADAQASPDGPGATLPPDQAWLADPDSWKLVDEPWWAPDCTVLEAVPGKLRFPQLVWASCGDGCDSADVVQGYGTLAYMSVASTEVLEGMARAYLLGAGYLGTTTTRYFVQRVIRLDDGQSVGAVALRESTSVQYASCVTARSAETAVWEGLLVDSLDGGTMKMTGSWNPGGGVVWRRPWVSLAETPAGRMTLDTEDHRRAFHVGFGAVRVQDEPTSSAYTTLESPSGSHIGAGQGDLAAWTDYALPGNPRIRGWAPDGKGVRTIVEGLAEETCELAVTPTDIVGLMGTEMGDWQCGADFSTAHLWRTPRAYGTDGVQLSTSPELPGTPFGANLRAWGDFAALAVQPIQPATDGGGPILGAAFVLVVQLSTWKMWRIDMPGGWMLHGNAFTVSPTHLYVGEHDAAEMTVYDSIHRIVRFELTKLDQVATVVN